MQRRTIAYDRGRRLIASLQALDESIVAAKGDGITQRGRSLISTIALSLLQESWNFCVKPTCCAVSKASTKLQWSKQG